MLQQCRELPPRQEKNKQYVLSSKAESHLSEISDDFAIGRKCLSVNKISGDFSEGKTASEQ